MATEPAADDLQVAHAFLIGAMKCGTWTMFKLLRAHPEVAPSNPKELKFFSRSAFRDWDQYHENFSIGKRTRVLLDGTVQYTRHPDTSDIAYKISLYDPEARFIYLMRDPVRRVESQLAHRVARGEIEEGAEARRLEIQRAITWSRYYTQIGIYANIFGPAQIYLQTFEHFIRNQVEVVKECFQFLNVSAGKDVEPLPPQNVRKADRGADEIALTEAEKQQIRDALRWEARSLSTAFGVDTSPWSSFWQDGS